MIEFCENCKEEGRYGVKATSRNSLGQHSCDECRLLEPLVLPAEIVAAPIARAVEAELPPVSIIQDVSRDEREPEFHLVACNPQQMSGATAQLTLFLSGKIASITAEMDELDKARTHAAKNRWNPKAFDKPINSSGKRLQYYHKLLKAVEAGFTIVPNFPIDIFAIRTRQSSPSKENVGYSNAWPSAPVMKSPGIPEGQGWYVSPNPSTRTAVRGDNNNRELVVYADQWQDVEFPVIAAIPKVMDTTAQAMALNLFDEIGISPAQGGWGMKAKPTVELPPPKGDPLIIGRIKHGGKVVSFLIAWHLDLRTL
jgi:hypothetical protein